MSNSRRWLVIAVAVAAAVIALIVLKPSDDSSDESPAPAAQSSRDAGASGTTGSTQATIKSHKPAVPAIRIRNGEPSGGPLEIKVENGQRVRFSVSSDAADEVHVHGFDLMKTVGPGKSAKFDFKANIEGAYEVELHHSGAVIAEIQVRPKG